jgi:hypothetical protein
MRKQKIDIKLHLIDPLIVATGCSWRRIIGISGRNVCVPTNNPNDNHPDLDASYEDLALLSAAPELYESNILLLNALNSVLNGDNVDNIDELKLIAEKALSKAEKSDF